MQRSKASASVEVKQVIGALCKLLATLGLDAVPTPETFRRAKFGGGPDVDKHLWQLLANILQKTCPVSLEISRHSKQELYKLVAAGLWQTGFYADWMYQEPKGGEGGEGSFSSRDLLLALGWLLAKGALEKLLSQRVEELDKTLFTSAPLNLESLPVSPDVQLDSNSLRRLQWGIGLLRHQGRILLSMQEERAQLLHNILSISPPSHVGSAPSDEGSALIKQDCACLQELCELLEAYLKWKKVESIFWTWMDSVVDCHLTDVDGRKPQAPVRSSDVCVHGNRGLEKLEDMLQRLPRTQEGPSKSRVDTEEPEHTAAGAQGGSDSASLETLLYPQPSLTQAYRARLQDTKPGRKSCSHALHEMSASEASKLLMQTEAQLLMKRDRLRRANRMLLEEMIESLDQLMLIPP